MQVGDCYEGNGHTVQIDRIANGQVYYAKYKARIGECGTTDNFCYFGRMDADGFRELVKEAGHTTETE